MRDRTGPNRRCPYGAATATPEGDEILDVPQPRVFDGLMRRRSSVLLVVIVGLSPLSVTTSSDAAVPDGEARQHARVYAAAPCAGRADMTAVLTYNPRRAQGDNLSLRVDDSVPGSRWRVDHGGATSRGASGETPSRFVRGCGGVARSTISGSWPSADPHHRPGWRRPMCAAAGRTGVAKARADSRALAVGCGTVHCGRARQPPTVHQSRAAPGRERCGPGDAGSCRQPVEADPRDVSRRQWHRAAHDSPRRRLRTVAVQGLRRELLRVPGRRCGCPRPSHRGAVSHRIERTSRSAVATSGCTTHADRVKSGWAPWGSNPQPAD